MKLSREQWGRDESPYESELVERCACTRHPSGNVIPPRPNCGTCGGTGRERRSESSHYFDGSGGLVVVGADGAETLVRNATPDEAAEALGSSAVHVKF